MPRLEESDSGHNLHSSRSHGYRQPLSPGRFQVESHRAPPVQPNQQKLGWRTPHRHRQDPQVHPYHQNGIRPYRQCVSHPRELRHRNQDLRRGNASTQPRSPRNARALELYRTPHSECELILGHRLNSKRMTKQQLIEKVAAKTELKKSEVEVAVDSVLAMIAEALQANERVDLRGFGCFVVKDRKERQGRNPRTGETI